MITITKVKIKGFRGFTIEQEFDLSTPVTILFGENGKGKSSLLNSIEWCLFGKECVGTNTGIRERIDWEVKNRNNNVDSCIVELEIKKDGSMCTIKREYSGRRRDSEISFQTGNETLRGEEAEKRLRELINRYSFKDFLSSVYQHQEVVRFFITQKPEERNDAIDRLLGLTEYRNIMDGIKKAEIKGENLENEIDNLLKQIKAKIDVYQTQIKEKEETLKSKGFREDEISDRGAEDLADTIKRDLKDFSVSVNLNLSEDFNTVTTSEISSFSESAKREITRLRSEMPDVKRQTEIYQRINELNKDLTEHKDVQNDIKELKRILEEFVQSNGRIEKLEEQKKNSEKDLKEKEREKDRINLLGAIIERAIDYLKSDIVTNKDMCPVCGSEKENLLQFLEGEYIRSYKGQLEVINREIESKRNELKKIEDLISEYKKIEERKLKAEERYKHVCGNIRNKWNISERDDIETRLNHLLNENERMSKEIQELVNKRQEELSKIENRIKDLLEVHEILKLRSQREKARAIEGTEDFGKLQKKVEEFKRLATQVEDIVSAVRRATQEEAKDKINAVKGKVDEYFKKMTKHPMISKLDLRVEEDRRTGGNSYNFKDQHGKDIIPILSQGNMNALALSIFLALTASGNSPFGFLMFDDPSQSLGSTEKREFINILNEIAEQKDLVISTMDREFFDLIKEHLTRQKIIYKFEDWSQDGGPQVKIEN